MSLEYVDDVHELVVENKRLKKENECLKRRVVDLEGNLRKRKLIKKTKH